MSNSNTLQYHTDVDDSQESEKSFGDWLQAIKRRKVMVILTIAVLLLLTVVIAFTIPAVYRSSSIILIEQQEIPQDFVRSTITTYADQRLQVIQQRAMTSNNLFRIIEKFNLYPEMLATDPREVVLEEMRESISLNMISADVIDPRSGRATEATIAFQVSFESKSPVLAQKVANEITGLFLEENIKERTSQAQNATQFLENESERLEKEIQEYETELADFKTGNVEKLPELVTMNLSLMDRADQDVKQIDQQLRTLGERKIYLESELAQMSPDQALFSEEGERLLGKGDRLKILNIELAQKAGIYSDDHPDILRIKREINSLEKDAGINDSGNKEAKIELQLLKQQLEEANLKYSQDHPDVKALKRSISALETSLASNNGSVRPALNRNAYPNPSEISNPAYTQLLAQLEATNTEMRSLRVTRTEMQEKLKMLEQRLIDSPEVEREYRALLRDYETAQAKYLDVKAKLNEAKIGESLELGNQGEKFTIIEPPLRPEQPVSPNRPAILGLGMLLSIGIAFGLVVLRESMDTSIYGKSTILRLTGYMPIATLPKYYTLEEQRKKNKTKILLISIIIFGIVLILSLVHFLHTPLDILYYKLLRKF